jgi:anti-sigma factor RsiW
MHRQAHPDPETLDRLRAGLLDDRPAEKADIEAHLATCEDCRSQQSTWTQIARAAVPDQTDHADIQLQLRQARNKALSSRAVRRHDIGLVPYATAALLLIAVSFGLWNYQSGDTQEPATVAQSVPDIYEDLDFYLWLANQKETATEDRNGNPDST